MKSFVSFLTLATAAAGLLATASAQQCQVPASSNCAGFNLQTCPGELKSNLCRLLTSIELNLSPLKLLVPHLRTVHEF